MMKRFSFACLLFIYSLNAFAQLSIEELRKKAIPIVEEGKKLYQSEMASWYGTDLFLEVFQDRPAIGGYFSYDEGDAAKCIFYSKGEQPRVIGTISFESTYDPKKAVMSLTKRDFTSQEQALYQIRSNALTLVRTDTLFKHFKNTDLNLIPIISNGEKKVYVLTGPKQTGIIIIGNDYRITYDKDNHVKEKKQLHKNILSFQYGSNDSTIESTHTHLPSTGDFITPTDICTLMLYEKFTTWKRHSVISKDYLSIWDCTTDKLSIIPMELIEKINQNKNK